MSTPAAKRRSSVPSGRAPPPLGAQLFLLGGFELRCEGIPRELPLSSQRLLAFLALHERPLHRTFVAETIWIDRSPVSASASLRNALWRLGHPRRPLIEVVGSHLVLASGVVVDVRTVIGSAHRVVRRQAAAEDVDTLCAAGDLLPDFYDDWLIIERERFRQARLHALDLVSDELLAAGEFAAATEAAYAAVACEPLRESAHRTLIRIHLAECNPGEALRQYDVYRRLLAGHLRLEPSEAMEALVRPLRGAGRGEP